jgi:hypothetical protein
LEESSSGDKQGDDSDENEEEEKAREAKQALKGPKKETVNELPPNYELVKKNQELQGVLQ